MKYALILAFAAIPAFADYVSPSEYRDFTCEELREDYAGIGSMMIDNIDERIGLRHDSIRNNDLSMEFTRLESRANAIEKAAKRINCDLHPCRNQKITKPK